jgi:hypothetical protein
MSPHRWTLTRVSNANVVDESAGSVSCGQLIRAAVNLSESCYDCSPVHRVIRRHPGNQVLPEYRARR